MTKSLHTWFSPFYKTRFLLIFGFVCANGLSSSAFTPADSIPPAAPTGLTARAIDGSVKLTWNANTEPDVKAYSIFRGIEGAQPVRLDVIIPSNVTEFTDDTFGPGLLRLTYQISAFDSSDNESDRSAPITLFALDEIPPAAPTGLAAQAIDGSVKLTWNANTEKDLGRYFVFRGEDGAQPVRLNITVSRTATEFIDNTTGPGLRNYTYQITASDFSRNESPRSAPVKLFTLDAIPPATPANFTAQAGDKNVVLTWTANTERDLSFYSMRKGVNGGPLTFMPSVSRSLTTLTDTDVTNGSVYAYQISAFDFSRNESVRSLIISVTPHAQGSISISPNPSTGPVRIQLPTEETSTLTVRSLSNGAVIYRGTYHQQSGINLDLGDVPPGTYILDVQQGGQTKSTRILIN